MKEINLDHCYKGASTPREVHFTKAVSEYMAKMIGWLARNGTEVQKTKEEV